MMREVILVEVFPDLDSLIPYEVNDNYLDPEGDILFLKSLLLEKIQHPLPSMQLHNEEMILVEKLMISRDHA